jgi:hypothetical protein
MKSCSVHYKVHITAFMAILPLAVQVPPCRGQADGQKTFTSSKAAVDALVQAAREDDVAALQAIFGPGSEPIVSSGDDVADNQVRERFVADYKTKHLLSKTGAHEFTLSVGNSEWPFPVPLVHRNNEWFWNGAAGKEEILYRRIGRNELAAINVCKGVVTAQREYASGAHDGRPPGVYATRLVSDAGKQNGLYWEVPEGSSPSPAGPLLAQADAEGYDTSKRIPYHGYYYRMLQDPHGFGFLAYPAEYRSSGVMTFIVDQTGTVYQKDLGEHTSEIAERMTDYKRDNTWARAE